MVEVAVKRLTGTIAESAGRKPNFILANFEGLDFLHWREGIRRDESDRRIFEGHLVIGLRRIRGSSEGLQITLKDRMFSGAEKINAIWMPW